MRLTLRLPNRTREFTVTLLATKGRCLFFFLPVQMMGMKNKNKKILKIFFQVFKTI